MPGYGSGKLLVCKLSVEKSASHILSLRVRPPLHYFRTSHAGSVNILIPFLQIRYQFADMFPEAHHTISRQQRQASTSLSPKKSFITCSGNQSTLFPPGTFLKPICACCEVTALVWPL